nr:transposase [Serratia silvae]
MAKQKLKITNWATDNKALVNRGSLTFWLDESVILAWYDEPKTASRGRPQRYSTLAISTVLMLKRVFRLTLRDYDAQVGEAMAMIRALNDAWRHARKCTDCLRK